MVVDEDGAVETFETEEEALSFAISNCAYDYRIVELY